MTSPWLTVVGLGEDGVSGLSPAARAGIAAAAVVVGGARQIALAAPLLPEEAKRIPWDSLDGILRAVTEHRGQAVVVLASGDPMHYGIGSTLARRFDPAEMTVIPHVGAFSLAAARLGWPLQEVEMLTVHGRPLTGLVGHFAPGARLLVLSADGDTPARVAALLTEHGFGRSRLSVLAHMDGPDEQRVDGCAHSWEQGRCADLNTLAIACEAAPDAKIMALGPGLPDDAYTHDGQITKREVRAATLAALAPRRGALLWDVGAGAGSIAIEWLRAHRSNRAVAVERDAARAAMIAVNAARLGVPRLEIVSALAPACLGKLPGEPDAIFIGGGISVPGLVEACWAALAPGGRLVANAVTIEAEARLLTWRGAQGGDLTRIAVSRLKPLGGMTGWEPLAPVTQYCGIKKA